MRRTLGNNKGVAMELAIATMLIIFALCMVLLVVAELVGVLNKRTVDTATARVAADSIGEDFFRAHRMDTVFYADRYMGKYKPVVQEDVAEDTDRLLVYYEGTSTPVLCVEVKGVGDYAAIVRWSYSYNEAAEGTEDESAGDGASGE